MTTSSEIDPKAPVIDSWGIRYPSFVAFLLGEPCTDDRCNEVVRAHRQKGRSQAFCKTFAEGYRRAPVVERDAHTDYNFPVTESSKSRDGWTWALEKGFVGPGHAAAYRANSWHNVRIGEGFDAARRAALSEPHPSRPGPV